MIEVVFFILFVALAAMFSAICDLLENENFYESVFKNLPERFWYKRVSWKYAKKIFGYKIDAWHLSKSAMIICIALAAVYCPNWGGMFILIIFGTEWIVCFNLCYNKFFRRKRKV